MLLFSEARVETPAVQIVKMRFIFLLSNTFAASISYVLRQLSLFSLRKKHEGTSGKRRQRSG